jgi:perosamine synthetase
VSERLAVDGGAPVRDGLLPYGRQLVDDEDVAAVVRTLRSDWLTTGPAVSEFERAFADCVGAREAVAVSSGTAALHAAMAALGVGPGDEVIVPTMTFAASANCVVYQGARPVFVDVDAGTLLVDPGHVERLINRRTRAVVAVDYAGHPCDYTALHEIADRLGLPVVADACHALGASRDGRTAGTLAALSAFSMHPVKHVTTGEGGVVTTDDPSAAARMRQFRNHGILTDHRQREARGTWFYEMADLGYNYRLSDLQCALGTSQLRKLPAWIARRQAIARRYDEAFAGLASVRPLPTEDGVSHARHLYVVRVDAEQVCGGRDAMFRALRAEGIGCNVHYVPVHLHPYYRTHLGTRPGMCPVAEQAYGEILSLPIFPGMTDGDVADVIAAVHKVADAYGMAAAGRGAARRANVGVA